MSSISRLSKNLGDLSKKIIPVLFFFTLLNQPSMAADDNIIRFGVLSIAQPSRIYAKWQPFADYMSQHLEQPVEIVIPRGFGKMKKTIAEGEVDFFYVNSHVFYRLKQEGKAIAVAQMKNIAGEVTSRSDVFVKKGSGIKTLADLRKKRIAFISPMGAGGYLAPRALMYQSGLKSGIDNEEFFTKNLSNSIHGVLLGEYDAATMCGVNYTLMSKKIETGELFVIAQSNEYPENVLGARFDIPENLRVRFQDTLLKMRSTPKGITLLNSMRSMKIQSFVKYDNSLEKITEHLLKAGKF